MHLVLALAITSSHLSANTGCISYAQVFGLPSLEEGQKNAMEKDAVMEIAACTKLLTAIAALQCVERDLIGLDDEVAGTVPELAQLQILTAMDSALGKPMLKRRANPITLRRLLAHSSGVIYDTTSPLNQKYPTHLNKPAINSGSTILTRFADPLLFEPGTIWHYGSGIDWVGLLVERLTGSNLEDYMREHIWNP